MLSIFIHADILIMELGVTFGLKGKLILVFPYSDLDLVEESTASSCRLIFIEMASNTIQYFPQSKLVLQCHEASAKDAGIGFKLTKQQLVTILTLNEQGAFKEFLGEGTKLKNKNGRTQ